MAKADKVLVEEYRLTLTKEEFLHLKGVLGKTHYSDETYAIWVKMDEVDV
jgi:hypothetical protein